MKSPSRCREPRFTSRGTQPTRITAADTGGARDRALERQEEERGRWGRSHRHRHDDDDDDDDYDDGDGG